MTLITTQTPIPCSCCTTSCELTTWTVFKGARTSGARRPNLDQGGALGRFVDAEFFFNYFMNQPSARSFLTKIAYFGGSNALWSREALSALGFRKDMQTEDCATADNTSVSLIQPLNFSVNLRLLVRTSMSPSEQ
eukprot:1738905-Amphidinium_carterae.1